MAFDTDTSADAALAIARLSRQVAALQEQVQTLKAQNDKEKLQRVVEQSKPPADTIYEIYRSIIDTSTEQTIPLEDPIGFNLSPTDVLYFVADSDTNGATATVRFSLNTYNRAFI